MLKGDRVLDLCAAPGGKSLVLASASGVDGSLVANDRSGARRARLVKVLDEHLPGDLRKTVTVTGFDAATMCKRETEAFDRVLLDAPCSSERHVIKSPYHLSKWTEARSRQLAQSAFAMLNSAFLLLKEGGTLLYSTCALSPLENDGVIQRFMKRRGKFCELLAAEAPIGESTEFGFHILPDTSDGRGPIYFALIRKTLSHQG